MPKSTPPTNTQPKVWKVDGIDVTPEEGQRYGVNPNKAPDYVAVQNIRKFREAKKLADAFYADVPQTTPTFTPPSTGGGGGGSTSTANDSKYNRVLADYARSSLGNIGTNLSAQETALGGLRTNARQRYDDYLAKLRGATTTAQGNISAATQALIAGIPQQAQAAPVLFQQPAAMENNVYSNYLRSIGMSAPEVANTQQFNSAQAQAANTLAQNSATASQAAQQQYLDNLRLTAQMAGTAANQRLASQVPAYELNAATTFGGTQNKIDEALEKARTGAATSRQSTLDALLPILLQYPSAAKDVLPILGLANPTAPLGKAKPKPKPKKGKK
jgi:hypothetical protein